jgi:L-fuculose-phosphate aldolase
MMSVSWRHESISNLLAAHEADVKSFMSYARRLVRRDLVCNTLGNIVLRLQDDRLPNGVGLLTKRRGVSLEELRIGDLVVTDVEQPTLYHGSIPPSGGHLLNQRLFRVNAIENIHAVIHTHADLAIGLLSQLYPGEFAFVSVDTAIVLGSPPTIFDYGVNPESDVDQIDEVNLHASCLLMPNHGITTVGSSLSEAYHRHTSIIAELKRLLIAMIVAHIKDRKIRTTPLEDTAELFALGTRFLYGSNT